MNSPKTHWTVIGIVAAILLAVSLFGLWRLNGSKSDIPAELPPVEQPPVQLEEEVIPAVDAPAAFAETMADYPDVYAWLQMPGTTIDYPVAQRFGDDSYYVQRDLDGKHDPAGTLFTEYQYNTETFDDPVTVIYGHHMRNGSMFGHLQAHMTDHPITEEDQIYVYLPDVRKTYQVFAAVPYDNSHILHYHNFHEPETFTAFFDEIMNTRSLSANVNDTWLPKPEDHVLILSTCLAENNHNRFLVLAVQTQEEPVNPMS